MPVDLSAEALLVRRELAERATPGPWKKMFETAVSTDNGHQVPLRIASTNEAEDNQSDSKQAKMTISLRLAPEAVSAMSLLLGYEKGLQQAAQALERTANRPETTPQEREVLLAAVEGLRAPENLEAFRKSEMVQVARQDQE